MSDIVGWCEFFATVTLLVLFGGVLAVGEIAGQRKTYGGMTDRDDD